MALPATISSGLCGSFAGARRATNRFSGTAGLRVLHGQRKQSTHAIVVEKLCRRKFADSASSEHSWIKWNHNSSLFPVPDNWRAPIFSTRTNWTNKNQFIPFNGQTITYSYVCADDPRCKVLTRRSIIHGDRSSFQSHSLSRPFQSSDFL